jgi:WD40 repeat protein
MGRVLLTNNEKEQYPFMFYSNELDRGLLTIYNLDHNKKHREILAHKSAVMTIATNAVGDIVATTSTYGEVIRLWSTMNGLKLCSFEKSRASVITSLCISRSSKFITACDNESNLSVFRIPLESILAFNEPAQEMEMEMTPLEQQTPL